MMLIDSVRTTKIQHFLVHRCSSRSFRRLSLRHIAFSTSFKHSAVDIATTPMASSAIDSQLIDDLEKLSLVNRKLVKSTTYAAPADPNITVRSWKMNEFKYYDVPSPFPTLARGLFSVESQSGDTGSKETSGSHRIVARGYDKFFNIGEVPWTTVRQHLLCLFRGPLISSTTVGLPRGAHRGTICAHAQV
jgi:hypothetical protein